MTLYFYNENSAKSKQIWMIWASPMPLSIQMVFRPRSMDGVISQRNMVTKQRNFFSRCFPFSPWKPYKFMIETNHICWHPFALSQIFIPDLKKLLLAWLSSIISLEEVGFTSIHYSPHTWYLAGATCSSYASSLRLLGYDIKYRVNLEKNVACRHWRS